MRRSSSLEIVAFRFTPVERAALRAWAAKSFPDTVLSDHEAAKIIVLERLVRDSVLDEQGRLTAPAPPTSKKRIAGSRLRSAREALGLKQEQVANKFRVPRATLAMWETGAKPIPARLHEIVAKWLNTGADPDPKELEQRERRTAWARVLDDKLIGDEDE